MWMPYTEVAETNHGEIVGVEQIAPMWSQVGRGEGIGGIHRRGDIQYDIGAMLVGKITKILQVLYQGLETLVGGVMWGFGPVNQYRCAGASAIRRN